MKKKIFFSLAVFLLVFSAASIVKASGNVTGWLWGGGTGVVGDGTNTNLGWISMNNTNCDTNNNGSIDVLDTGPVSCPPIGTMVASYGVAIPAAAGNVTGYAWSENLGWIDFDPTGPYPVVPNNSVTRNGNNLEGWARIMSIAEASAVGNSGGWEGWISMSGTATDGSTYGVDINKMDGTGVNPTYAWSDELGWIDFSRASVDPTAKILKVCRNNCGSGIVRDGTTFSMTVASTENLVACYTSTACLDPAPGLANNVTNAAAWNETGLPQDAISLSLPGTNPRVVTANSPDDSEQVKVFYNPGTGNINANFTVNVAGNTLKVCHGGCVGGTKIDGGVLNMEVGDTENLTACYGLQIGCTGGADVTNDISTTWDDTDILVDSVSFSAPGVIDADNIGNETVDVKYDPAGPIDITVNFNANVTASTSGPNWREVAP